MQHLINRLHLVLLAYICDVIRKFALPSCVVDLRMLALSTFRLNDKSRWSAEFGHSLFGYVLMFININFMCRLRLPWAGHKNIFNELVVVLLVVAVVVPECLPGIFLHPRVLLSLMIQLFTNEQV